MSTFETLENYTHEQLEAYIYEELGGNMELINIKKESLLQRFNKIFRKDAYIIALCNSLGIEMSKIDELSNRVYLNMFFDTMDEEYGIPIMAKTLNLTIPQEMTIENKRSTIAAKWKSKGKSSEELLQNIANSWKYGEVTVKFEDDLIRVYFAENIAGIPDDIESLQSAIDKAKPAYLLAIYMFNWLYWDLFESWNFTWDEFESKNLSWDSLEKQLIKP